MIAADVQSLRKGLDLTKAEKDRQPKNFIIFVSFSTIKIFNSFKQIPQALIYVTLYVNVP